MNQEPNPATIAVATMIVAYRKEDVEGFNSGVGASTENWLAEPPPEGLTWRKVGFEDFFNHFEPFYWALVSVRRRVRAW